MLNRYRHLTSYEVSNLLYHLTGADRWDLLPRVALDLEYIAALFATGTHNNAIAEYSRALAILQPHVSDQTFGAMRATRDFIRTEYDYLTDFPTGVLQQAENRPDDSPVHRAALSLLERVDRASLPRFRFINKPSGTEPLLIRLKDGSSLQKSMAGRGYPGWVRTCAWIGADQVLSAGDDNQITLWDIHTGKVIASRPARGSALGFSPSGSLLLTTASGHALMVDCQTGNIVDQTAIGGVSISSYAFSPDDEVVAIGGQSGDLIVWNRQSGEVTHIPTQQVQIKCCTWSPDARNLVWCAGANPLIVWDRDDSVQRGKLGDARTVVKGNVHTWTTFSGHKGGANACAWSPDGRFIASGSGHGFGLHDDDFSVRIWDATSLNELAILKGHRDRITSLSWSPDSHWLASTSGSVMSPGKDNAIRLWDVASLTSGAVLVGHTNEVVSCAWQSDARHLVSASKDGTLIVWDTENTGHSPVPVLDAYVSNSGAMAALARKDNGLEIIDARTGAHLQTFHGHEDQITACAWSPDDLIVATGSLDRTARLWDIGQRKELAVLRGHSGDETYTAGGHRIVWGKVADIGWSPDGQLLATAGSDRVIIVWARSNYEKYRTLLGHIGPVERCGWCPDGKALVSVGGRFEHIVDTATLLWDVHRGCERGQLTPNDPLIESAMRRPLRGAGRIVSSDRLGIIEVSEKTWSNLDVEITRANARSWKLKLEGRLNQIAWLPNSEHFVIALGSFIRLFDAVQETEVLRFRATANVKQLCLSHAGRHVLAVDESGALYILAVEGVTLHTPSIIMSRPWHSVTGEVDNAHTGACPVCGNQIRSMEPARVTACPFCEIRLTAVIVDPTPTGLSPIDAQSSEAWLRIIRGVLINQTADRDELLELYRRLAALDDDGDTFTGAIQDPHSSSIAELNSALWTTGALVLRTIDDRLAEKCLRTALVHMPEDQQASGHLASQWTVAGRLKEALALANTLPKTLLKSCIDDAIQIYREVSNDIAEERLIEFKALCWKRRRSN